MPTYNKNQAAGIEMLTVVQQLLLPLLATAWLCLPATAAAGAIFKCDKGIQDKPCENKDVQERFANGSFSVQQTNSDTNRECAAMAGELLPLWKRINDGEKLETIKPDPDKHKVVSKMSPKDFDKLLRELEVLKGVKMDPTRLRSEFEGSCMKIARSSRDWRKMSEEYEAQRADEDERWNARHRANKDRKQLRDLCRQQYGRPDC